MRTQGLLALLWILPTWVVVGGQSAPAGTATAPSTAPAPEAALTVDSLNHAARCLGHLRAESVVARFGRIRALLGYAGRLQGDHVQTNRQLVDLYEGSGDLERATAAADRYLRARPDDYAVAVRWMRLGQATLNRADQRRALLEEIVAREQFLPEFRAAAAAELCQVYFRQGETAKSKEACRRALQLDPHEPTALREQARLEKKTGLIDAFQLTMKSLQANPRDLDAAWELAQRLQSAGLYLESLKFYEHGYALSKDRPPAHNVLNTLLIDYANAMLDSGQAAKAVELFESVAKEHGHSLALRSLMVEACRSLGQDDQAKAHIDFMARVYEPLSAPAVKRTGSQMAELGWFDLHFRAQPKVALEWAKAAEMSAGDDPFIQRVLGAASMEAGQVQEGLKLLTPLVAKDPFAATILARHYFAAGAPAKAREVLLEAAGNPRTGPAWRELAAVASKHKVALPPVPHAKQLRDVQAKLPADVFQIGRFPERLVSITLAAAANRVAPGEPIAVTLELKNVSQHRLTLGPDGLFTPVVFLSLDVEGAAKTALPNLTAAHLPAPRYLPPGQSVRQRVRLDVGPAQTFLMAHPIADLKLTVSAILDPLQRGDKVTSSAPGVKIPPVEIERAGFLKASADETAVRYALAYIVRDLKQDDLPAQLRAARLTASLLGYVRNAEQAKTEAVFPKVLTKPILLSMTRAFLRAPSALVRAEMLAALQHVDLDKRIIALMGPNVEDPSPLVRMRLIELLAGQRTEGHETLLEVFAKDPDAAVREMAAAFGREK